MRETGLYKGKGTRGKALGETARRPHSRYLSGAIVIHAARGVTPSRTCSRKEDMMKRARRGKRSRRKAASQKHITVGSVMKRISKMFQIPRQAIVMVGRNRRKVSA